jgi:hypothetical protein
MAKNPSEMHGRQQHCNINIDLAHEEPARIFTGNKN